MKIFAETFQSCFKDGLDGTIDFRMIPSAIVLISVLFLGNNFVFSMRPHGYTTTIGCICGFLSLIISYLRPCNSLIMNMSLSFHTTLLRLLGIFLSIWEQNFLVSSEAVAIAFAIFPFIPHTMIMMWAVYNIMNQIGSQVFFKCINNVQKRFRGEKIMNMRRLMQEEGTVVSRSFIYHEIHYYIALYQRQGSSDIFLLFSIENIINCNY